MAKKDPNDIRIIKRLISEEKEAIASYKQAIIEVADDESKEVFEHILEEEEEHVKELNKLLPKNMRDAKIKDSILQE